MVLTEKKDKILIYGGISGNRLNDLWMIDLSKEKLEYTLLSADNNNTIPNNRSCVMATFYDDYFYIFGGLKSDGGLENDLCRYGPFSSEHKNWERVKTFGNFIFFIFLFYFFYLIIFLLFFIK